jgi:hypothetical protein
MASCIRLAQMMKASRPATLVWRNENGITLMLNEVQTNIFCTLFWINLYERDFVLSTTTEIPFQLAEDITISLTFPPDYLVEFNPFYQSGLWYYYAHLINISRKVIELGSKMKKGIDFSIYLADQALLHQSIDIWFQDLPEFLRVIPETYTLDLTSVRPPPWYVAYIQCVFFGMKIMLYRSTFLIAIDSNADPNSDISILTCLDAANAITRIIERFEESNHNYDFVPYFISHSITLAGLVHCVSCRFLNETTVLGKLHLHYKALQSFVSFNRELETFRSTFQRPDTASIALLAFK